MSRRSLSHYQRHHPLLMHLERWLHRSVKALIENSSAVAAELIEESGTPHHPQWHGIAAARRCGNARRRRRALNIPDDAFVIAVIANLIPYKGHADLLAALGAVRNRLTVPLRLMLVGRDQGTGAPLQRQADELGIADGMMWLGERADSQALIAAADLGVVPSHQEGFSNSLIEHVLPVIATRIGGNIDTVDGETGRLVPVSDIAALGEAIATQQENSGLRARMGPRRGCGSKGRSRWQACCRRHLNLSAGLSSVKQSRSRSLLIHPKHASLSPQRPPSRADPP